MSSSASTTTRRSPPSSSSRRAGQAAARRKQGSGNAARRKQRDTNRGRTSGGATQTAQRKQVSGNAARRKQRDTTGVGQAAARRKRRNTNRYRATRHDANGATSQCQTTAYDSPLPQHRDRGEFFVPARIRRPGQSEPRSTIHRHSPDPCPDPYPDRRGSGYGHTPWADTPHAS